MARGRPGGGSKARAPAENEIATATALAPNGNAAEGKVPAAPKLNYSYSPRLDPILRFDTSGAADKLPDLLEKAKREPLTEAEAHLLAEALRRHEPWLEWAGKREAKGFAVDPVALHIHERVSTKSARQRTKRSRRYDRYEWMPRFQVSRNARIASGSRVRSISLS